MFIASQPSCPPLLASRFAENQTAWRQQGRFITYCSRGGGFGSWLRGLGSAFAISILAERALILDGTCKQLPTAVAKHVAEYFQGNGFNWTVGAGRGQRVQVERRGHDRMVTLSPICRASVRPCGYSRTMVQGQLVTDSTLLELHAGEHEMVDKIRDKASRARVLALFGGGGKQDSWLDIWDALHSCALGLLMQPTRWLTALTDAFLSRHGVERDADGEPLLVAIHARLGDGNMRADRSVIAANQGDVRWVSEQRANAMRTDPLRALSCFSTMQPGSRYLLITDSSDAAECARRNGVITTRGDAVHLGAASHLKKADVDKLMLDWWLLAVAQEAGRTGLVRSNFLASARWRHGEPPLKTRDFSRGCNRSAAFAVKCGTFDDGGLQS
jgi:hypothetical protein